MAVNQYQIEAFFDSEELRYFRDGQEAETGSWFLMFGSKTGVHVRLLESGECILVRSQALVHLDEMDAAGRNRVWEAMAYRNDRMVVGRYSGVDSVVVEAALPIEDGTFTDNQLKRVLGVVVNESNCYGPHLRQIAHDLSIPVREDPIDGLMRKLFQISDQETQPDDTDSPEPDNPPQSKRRPSNSDDETDSGDQP